MLSSEKRMLDGLLMFKESRNNLIHSVFIIVGFFLSRNKGMLDSLSDIEESGKNLRKTL